MPKKNLLIGTVVVVLLFIIGAIGFMMMSKSSQKSVDELGATKETEQDSSDLSTKKESFMSLLSAGKNVACTFTALNETSSGIVYVSDKKMRGDFIMIDEAGKETESHMIQDGDVSYFWTGLQGTKMKVDVSVGASPASGTVGQGAELEKQQDMNCSDWGVDSSKFVVPTDVKFMDVSGITQIPKTNIKPGASSVPSTNKSVCDAIADPVAKASCIGATGSSGY